jgi:DNA-binding response OmpR family regulator
MLFVDDEPSIRLTLPPVLEEYGFQIRVADSVLPAFKEISSTNSTYFSLISKSINRATAFPS